MTHFANMFYMGDYTHDPSFYDRESSVRHTPDSLKDICDTSFWRKDPSHCGVAGLYLSDLQSIFVCRPALGMTYRVSPTEESSQVARWNLFGPLDYFWYLPLPPTRLRVDTATRRVFDRMIDGYLSQRQDHVCMMHRGHSIVLELTTTITLGAASL